MAKKKKKEDNKRVDIKNRKAAYEYSFVQELEAGIMLTGTEIKSVRANDANLKDAFCYFKDNELWVKNMFIGEYKFGNYNNHETRRERKLLLKKTELKKWQRRVTEKGFSIIPFRLYLSERGLAKLELKLAQGKKSYDKRASIKDRENKRDMDRLKKMRL